MRRRDFIAGLGSAAAWPLEARAQDVQMRRIGAISISAENDAGAQDIIEVFVKRLRELGWIEGRNIRIDYRYPGNDAARLHAYARELVALRPDVIFAMSPAVTALKEATRTIPIVFSGGADPIAGGLVASLARPDGNVTGFANNPPSIATKRLVLLREIAPQVLRVAMMYDPAQAPDASEFLAELQAAAPSLRAEVVGLPARNIEDAESGIAALARMPDGGLVVYAGGFTITSIDAIAAAAAKYKIPAIYRDRRYVAAGGLASYGTNGFESLRGAADYVDRILRGAKPADLPVQLPTKFELVINLKTAKALGLSIPETLLATADEVIQ
jgi:putative tryptophan/tyrosine transport system substrate-binding protein